MSQYKFKLYRQDMRFIGLTFVLQMKGLFLTQKNHSDELW